MYSRKARLVTDAPQAPKNLTFGVVCKSLISRIAFALHCVFAFLWILGTVEWTAIYAYTLLGLLGLLAESVFTIYYMKGMENRW